MRNPVSYFFINNNNFLLLFNCSRDHRKFLIFYSVVIYEISFDERQQPKFSRLLRVLRNYQLFSGVLPADSRDFYLLFLLFFPTNVFFLERNNHDCCNPSNVYANALKKKKKWLNERVLPFFFFDIVLKKVFGFTTIVIIRTVFLFRWKSFPRSLFKGSLPLFRLRFVISYNQN